MNQPTNKKQQPTEPPTLNTDEKHQSPSHYEWK